MATSRDWVIVKIDITQGEAYGGPYEKFDSKEEAERAFAEGRKSGEYVDEGHHWSGRVEWALCERRDGKLYEIDGETPYKGPHGAWGFDGGWG